MRKQKSMKNFLTSIIPFFILTILGFIRLKVLLNSLGEEVYALNQLFIQIFSYVSLLEGGIGALITQLYYQYFANNDEESIRKVFTTSKKILNKISIIMLISGILISFLLGFLTNNDLSLIYMQIVFMLYLFRSVLEYFMFAPRFVLTADQKMYKINISLNIFKILEIIIEILILQFYKEYIIILISSIVLRYIAYYLTNKIVYKEYPWLHEVQNNATIPFTKMKNVIIHKLSGTIYSNTDILLASSFLKPLSVVIYSSYNYIMKFIVDGIYLLGSSITASMGNVMYNDDEKNQYNIFETTNEVFICCAIFFSTTIYLSTNRFIQLWLGNDKLLDNWSFFYMIMVLFLTIIIKPFTIIRDTKALYKETQKIAIGQAIINFLLSIILVQFFEIKGLLFATVIASLLTENLFYPIYIYKNQFKKDFKAYFYKIFVVSIFTILLCFVLGQFNIINQSSNYLEWFLYSCFYASLVLILDFLFCLVYLKKIKLFIKEIIQIFKIHIRNGVSHEK